MDKKQEFFKIMLTLRQTYGEGSYHDNVLAIWWKQLNHVKIEKLKQAVDMAIANNPNFRYPPSLMKIEKELSSIRESDYVQEKKENLKNALSGYEISEFFKNLSLSTEKESKSIVSDPRRSDAYNTGGMKPLFSKERE